MMMPMIEDRYIKFDDWLATKVDSTTYGEKLKSEISDDILYSLIDDWFFDYRIGWSDPARFYRYLKRNVQTCQPQYHEMLRIQPGFAKYDYAVTHYSERQLSGVSDTSASTTRGKDTTTVAGNSSCTENGQTSGTSDSVRTGGETHAHTGTDSTESDSTRNTIHSGGYKETSIEGEHTSESERVEGLHTQSSESIDGLHKTEVSPHVEKITSTDGDNQGWSGDSSIQATLPMSKSYSKSDIIEPDSTVDGKQEYEHAYQHMPALDWSTASAQSQTGHREYGKNGSKTTESYKYSDGTGDITTTEGTADSPDKTSSKRQGDESSPDTERISRQGSATNPDTREVTYQNETNAETGGGSAQTTYDTTDKTTYDSITDNGTTSGTSTRTASGENNQTSESTYGNIDNKGSATHTDKEVSTGHDGQLAQIMQNAKNFIARSNAWVWMREQLEPCFLTSIEE